MRKEQYILNLDGFIPTTGANPNEILTFNQSFNFDFLKLIPYEKHYNDKFLLSVNFSTMMIINSFFGGFDIFLQLPSTYNKNISNSDNYIHLGTSESICNQGTNSNNTQFLDKSSSCTIMIDYPNISTLNFKFVTKQRNAGISNNTFYSLQLLFQVL